LDLHEKRVPCVSSPVTPFSKFALQARRISGMRPCKEQIFQFHIFSSTKLGTNFRLRKWDFAVKMYRPEVKKDAEK
jgi:hypothetical protein